MTVRPGVCPWGPGPKTDTELPPFVGRAKPRPLPTAPAELPIYARDLVADPETGARPGVHYQLGLRVGFIPEPQDGAKKGVCWWCRAAAIGPWPPLCVPCGRLCFGDEGYRPEALARRGIIVGRRAR